MNNLQGILTKCAVTRRITSSKAGLTGKGLVQVRSIRAKKDLLKQVKCDKKNTHFMLESSTGATTGGGD